MKSFENPAVIAALIAAITSILTLIISSLIKSYTEKNFLSFKLESEYRYEQRKKIKEILSKNKMQLLNAAESLNHRLWNFSENYIKCWHRVEGEYEDSKTNYYFSSFIYRLVVLFSWIRKIEKEMIYLDTTIASKKDIDFIKYLRLLPQMFCDSTLLENLNYDFTYARDHFFKNDFERMVDSPLKNDTICDFTDFKNNYSIYTKELGKIFEFLDGLSPDENRYRWDMLQTFHYALIAFINSYGYDFQYTDKSKLNILIGKNRLPRNIENFCRLTRRNMIYEQKEMKKIIRLLVGKNHEELKHNSACMKEQNHKVEF